MLWCVGVRTRCISSRRCHRPSGDLGSLLLAGQAGLDLLLHAGLAPPFIPMSVCAQCSVRGTTALSD